MADDANDAVERNHQKSKEVQSASGSKSDQADTTATLQPLAEASAQDWLGSNQDPDVLLAVPNLGVDHIGLVVDDLYAHVELHAKVLDLLELHVGADVGIKKVDLQIDNVRVQAMLKVRLDKVVEVVGRVMDTIDEHPEILSNLTGGLGKGLEGALTQGGSSGDDNDGGQKEIEGRSNVSYDENKPDQNNDTKSNDKQEETDRDRRSRQRDERRRQRRAQRR